ncbi:hypothetical protein BCO_0900055 (plasmid) [Borrelia coriaceae ATCC 43381]|uniref:Uncharacterized protein n=1 Tax=Borrelia coriaceae ATCC 43381 TaxID=1408429 RepID=W5SWB1_9SPIR|nr:hypothetical protein BCO_0900055 [Borrelia coriaceae ATCC 43381]
MFDFYVPDDVYAAIEHTELLIRLEDLEKAVLNAERHQ